MSYGYDRAPITRTGCSEAGMSWHKYGAKGTTVDGINFPSKKEADYYCELKLRKMAGDIKDFSLQPEFTLQEAFTDSNGVKHRAIKYRADFLITYSDGTEEVVDVKGVRTAVYALKKKLFLARYPHLRFREVD